MFEYKVAEINIQTDFTKFNFKDNDYCLLYFHYNKNKITEDYQFVKAFEETYKYHLNWIDISDLFDNYKNLHKKLNLTAKFQENFSEDYLILNYIKEYVFDQLIRTGKYYKI